MHSASICRNLVSRAFLYRAVSFVFALHLGSAEYNFAQLLDRPTIPVESSVVLECDDLRLLLSRCRTHLEDCPEFDAVLETIQSPVTSAVSFGTAGVVTQLLGQIVSDVVDTDGEIPMFASLTVRNANPVILLGFGLGRNSDQFRDKLQSKLQDYKQQLQAAKIGLETEFIDSSKEDQVPLNEIRVNLRAPWTPNLVGPVSIAWTVQDQWVLFCSDPETLSEVVTATAVDVRSDRSYKTLIAQFSEGLREPGYLQVYVRPLFLRSQLPRQWQLLWNSLNLSDIAGIGAQFTFEERQQDGPDFDASIRSNIKLEARINTTTPRSGIFKALDRIAPLELPRLDYSDVVLLQAFSFDWSELYLQFVRSYEAVNGKDSASFIEVEMMEEMALLRPGERLTDLTRQLSGVVGSMVVRSANEFTPIRFFEFSSGDAAHAFAQRMSTAGTPYDRENPFSESFDGVLHSWQRAENVFRQMYDRNKQAYGGLSMAEAWQRDEAYYQRDQWFFIGNVGNQQRLTETNLSRTNVDSVFHKWQVDANVDGRFYLSITDGEFWQRRIQTSEYVMRHPIESGIVAMGPDGIARLTSIQAIDEAGLTYEEVLQVLQLVLTDQAYRLIQARFGEQLIEAFAEPSGLRILVTLRPFVFERKKQ